MKLPRTLRLRCLCLLLLSFPGVNSYGQIPTQPPLSGPLPVEIAAAAKSFGASGVDLSPDGLWVAYTLSDPRRRKLQGVRNDQWAVFNCTGAPYLLSGTDVLITNTQTGQTINISSGKGANWGPRWSPDGKSLAFYSDRTGKAHVWLWERSSAKLRPLPSAVVHVRFNFEKMFWSPDSRKVITKVLGIGQRLDGCFDPLALPAQSEPSSRIVYDSDSPANLTSSTDSFLSDLAVIEVTTGKLKRIVRQRPIAGYSLSPAGDRIVFSSAKGRRPNDQYLFVYDLTAVSLSDLQIETVQEFLPGVPSLTVSWSADGRRLAYLSNRECFIWQLGQGEPQKISAAPPNGFGQTPLWDKDARSVYLIGDNRVWRVSATDAKAVAVTEKCDRQIRSIISRADENEFWCPESGQSLYVSTNDSENKQEGFYKVDLHSGKFVRVLETRDSYNPGLSTVSRKNDAIIFASQNSQHEQNLWLARKDFAHPQQLTQINPELERYRAGAARLIDYTDGDGKKLQATLLLPANYQQNTRYPLIVWVYGGSMLSANVNRYGATGVAHQNLQLLSSRGYAVLLPDSPLRVGTPMKDLAKTVLPAVDKTIEMGIVDGERLGIMGLSYGGYSTLALIAQTTRFKAAVMDVGLGNLTTKYGEMTRAGMPLGVGWAEEGQGGMGGPPWEFPERYIQNSPLFYLNKIQTPLLINQGGMDMSPHQSDEVFVGLRRLGKKVVYVRYENEGHGIECVANRVDYWNRVINWFGLHLSNKTPFTPGKISLAKAQRKSLRTR